MANKKIYTVVKTTNYGYDRKPSVTEVTGTIEEIREYFSYTLEVGHSWEPKKVNMFPKTINSLLNNINKAFDIKNACRFTSSYVELKQAA